MNTHQNKVAIVTDGKQGIGRGVADLFARRGATVIIVNRGHLRARSAHHPRGGWLHWLRARAG